jgi:hypothetical protein
MKAIKRLPQTLDRHAALRLAMTILLVCPADLVIQMLYNFNICRWKGILIQFFRFYPVPLIALVW